MDRFRIKAAVCQYKEYDGLLTQQFMSGLNGNGMVSEILKDVSTLEDIEDAQVIMYCYGHAE